QRAVGRHRRRGGGLAQAPCAAGARGGEIDRAHGAVGGGDVGGAAGAIDRQVAHVPLVRPERHARAIDQARAAARRRDQLADGQVGRGVERDGEEQRVLAPLREGDRVGQETARGGLEAEVGGLSRRRRRRRRARGGERQREREA